MYRTVRMIGVIGSISLLFLQFNACSNPPKSEPAPKEQVKDSGTPKDTQPEPDKQPDKNQRPKKHPDVGKTCRLSPRQDRGTCAKGLFCHPLTDTKFVCFENCTADGLCPEGEVCRPSRGHFKICKEIVEAGKKCDSNKLTFCHEDFRDPPEYCLKGVCTKKPKTGWVLGQRCTEPRGDQQSDCKSGLLCLPLLKGEFYCLKKCSANGDCPKGEVCWDKILGKKACLFASKEGQDCTRLNRRFCKSDDEKNKPLTCKNNKCESTIKVKKVGQICTQNADPNVLRGDCNGANGCCEDGNYCLGISDRASSCHQPCGKGKKGCPSGEVCMRHPNPGGNAFDVCVIPVKKGGACDLKIRKLCQSSPSLILACKEGKCIEIKVGDSCKSDDDCGPMACIGVDAKVPDKKYCLARCDAKHLDCPGKGTCQEWGKGGPTACVPVGPKKEDELCRLFQALGNKLNTTQSCVGGYVCVTLDKGSVAGICMQKVAKCSATACSTGHLCLPQNLICVLDCSTGGSKVCKPGTTCRTAGKLKLCGPPK